MSSQGTSCAGRFPELCSTSLPAVVNYDFESNLSTRGIENRTFRWEDIYVSSTWLFKEVTTTGYTSNWLVTGNYSFIIPITGNLFHSGNLNGYTGTPFYANPISTGVSVGLWCNSTGVPLVYATGLTTGQNGILLGNNHQTYLVAKCEKFTGNSPRLTVYLKANDTTSGLGYYDPINKEWTLSVPTGSFQVNLTGYTEIKYNFNPSSLPFSTPAYYDLIIENHTTGSFITVDDIHIDQYMRKNPYVDYILPTGYLLQLTPDLGWHNSLQQFESDGKNVNPFLKTFGPYMLENGNLEDNLDNTVSAIIDSGDFSSVVQSKYKKYLWRAIGILPNGSLGEGGLPEKFEFVGEEIENAFSIKTINNLATSTIKTIIGNRNSRMRVLVDGIENHPGLEYPTKDIWKLSINVEGVRKTVELKGKDIGGATTRPRYVELNNPIKEFKEKGLWNVFDDHGLLLDLKRLPNESNKEYSIRLKDVNVNRGGSTFIGVNNGAIRELGLIKVPTALSITIPKDRFNNNIYDSLNIIYSSASFSVRSPGMVISERLNVDRVYGTVDLSKSILDFPIRVLTDDGFELPITDIELDIDEDRPSIQRIKILDQSIHGSFVTVVYNYYETLRYKDYQNIGSLFIAIKLLTDNTGKKLVDVILDPKMSGGEHSFGLFIGSDIISGDQISIIAWSPVILRKVSDKEFREFFISNDGTYHKTKFQNYVTSLRRNSRSFWTNIIADVDYWVDDDLPTSFDFIPTVFDPIISSYSIKGLSGNNIELTTSEAWGRSFVGYSGEYIDNLGIDYRAFQPGVGFKSDLEPNIEAYQIIYNKSINNVSYSVESINTNNKSILFSGQR